MKRRDLEVFLETELETFLSTRSFEYVEPLTFIRTSPRCQQLIVVGASKRNRVFRLEIGVRVRFPEVQELLDPESKRDPLAGTYGGLIHLVAGIPFKDWVCTDISDLRDFVQDGSVLLSDSGIPFLERHDSIEEVRRKLASPEPTSWLTYDDQGRHCVLGAIAYTTQGKGPANALLREYMERNSGKPRKHWVRVEDLLSTIAQLPPK